MELNITKDVFKAQAKKQHAALIARNIELKLSDIQESLAIAFGYANLATLYAVFHKEEYSEVDSAAFRLQTANLFVITWVEPDASNDWDEVIGVYPPGTTLDDFRMHISSNYAKIRTLNTNIKALPEGMVFSEETIALETYVYVPNISKYGLEDAADERLASNWAKEYLGYRVPRGGVDVRIHEQGDDSGSKVHVLIWLNDEDSAKVRALYAN